MALCRNIPWVDHMCLVVFVCWLEASGCGPGCSIAKAPREWARDLPSGDLSAEGCSLGVFQVASGWYCTDGVAKSGRE